MVCSDPIMFSFYIKDVLETFLNNYHNYNICCIHLFYLFLAVYILHLAGNWLK